MPKKERPHFTLPPDHFVFAGRRANAARQSADGEHYRQAIEAFRAEHTAWSNDRFRARVDERLAGAFTKLFEDFEAPAPRPGGWNGIFTAVARLKERWEGYLHELDRRPGTPPDSLWGPVEEVYGQLANVTPREATPVEPVKLLWEQGVSLEQIGRMHGYVDEHGNGLAHIVRRLVDEPDTDPKSIDLNAPKTALDYWREGLDEYAAVISTGLPAEEISRLWIEYEDTYGPQRYMTPEELARHNNEKKYAAKNRELVRQARDAGTQE